MKRLYNLNGLDIEVLLKNEGFKDSFIKKHINKYYYLLSKILFKYAMGVEDKKGYVRISSAELIEKFAQTGKLKNNAWIEKKKWKNKWMYLIIREQLYDWGVIHFKTNQKDETTKEAQYKILDEWRIKSYHKINPTPSECLNLLLSSEIESINYTGVYKDLQNNLNLLKLNQEEINQWLEVSIKNKYQLPNKTKNYFKITDRIINNNVRDEWQIQIDNCIENNWYMVDLGKSGRVYSPYTSLPKQIRKFVRINDKISVEIDISNSQPLLFSILLIQWANENGFTQLPNDIRNYIRLCEEGKFYKHVMKLITNEGLTIKYKQDFKIDFFSRVFFSKETKQYKWRNIFAKNFPNVSNCITDLKNKFNKEQNLAVMLQKLEADIMIKGTCRNLINTGINEFYTIHDSIVTTIEYIPTIIENINSEFKIYGLKPKLKIKTEDLMEFILMKILPHIWVSYNYCKGNGILKFNKSDDIVSI